MKPWVMRFAAMLGTALVAAACNAASFSFAAFGDVGYNSDEETQLPTLMAEMNHQRPAFAIHVGDFKDARTECSDALFRQRREIFALSHHALFYTPGDNEWVDCRRARYAPHDPLERLDKLRELFFSTDASLGQAPISTQRQSARGYPENMRWSIADVVFATMNIPGPDNNRRALPVEAQRRTPAVLEWMRAAFRAARASKASAVVLATQANLFTGNSGFRDIIEALSSEARAYRGEVLLVHGDTHWFHFDKPLPDVPNLSRLEVHGSPFVDWTYVTVATGNGKATFSVTPGSVIATRGSRSHDSR